MRAPSASYLVFLSKLSLAYFGIMRINCDQIAKFGRQINTTSTSFGFCLIIQRIIKSQFEHGRTSFVFDNLITYRCKFAMHMYYIYI